MRAAEVEKAAEAEELAARKERGVRRPGPRPGKTRDGDG